MRIIKALGLALAASAGIAAAGCGTTNNISSGGGTSGLGQSCQRTFDCASGLVCEANICLTAASADASTSDGSAAGDGGSTIVTAHLGLVNESCQRSSDCSSPLACVSDRCEPVSYGLTVTGKSCTGECNTAADCCEIPANLYVGYLGSWYGTAPDGGLGPYHPELAASYVRCEDLLAYLGGSTAVCGTPTAQTYSGPATACFDYGAYCSCAANTWACNSNMCAFTAPCSTPGLGGSVVNGCPTQTRTGRALSSTCSAQPGGAMGTCAGGCVTPADCAGTIPPSGRSGTAACSAADAGPSDCTCYKSTCYFKCTKDLDCAGGSVCDTATNLCKSAGCQSDADCVQSTGEARDKCVSGACEIACTQDIECNPPTTICSGGYCMPSGCSSDTECSGGTHYFCVPTSPSTYSSAVTN